MPIDRFNLYPHPCDRILSNMKYLSTRLLFVLLKKHGHILSNNLHFTARSTSL